MERVTYIIPLHEWTEETEKYAAKAFDSLSKLSGTEKFEVLLVGELDVITKAQKLFNESGAKQLTTFVPTDIKDVFEKINYAVTKCATPYFSVLEFDDEFYPYWNTVAQRYVEQGQYSVILPLTELINTNGELCGLANELAWDAAFGDAELGFVEKEDLLIFKDFITSGAYIRTQDFLALGKLKSDLKFLAWYEYLLNTTNNGKKVFVAPRIGYKHTVLRDGSYTDVIFKGTTREEAVAIFERAVKPYKPTDKGKSKKDE